MLHQYLIPPGQKQLEINRFDRSFEDVIYIYKDIIRRLDVVLLSYKITDLNSYYDIEYWVEKINQIGNDRTNFILVGTHLDKEESREVNKSMIDSGKNYVIRLVKNLRPTWNGFCTSMEVSNHSGENISRLRRLISGSIIHASGFQI